MNLLDSIVDDSLFCRIYIENSNRWIDGVLLYVDLEKNIADIFLSTRHFRNLLNEGSKVIIKSVDSNQEYIFTGIVSRKILSIRKQSISVKIEEVLKFNNSRLNERFNVNYPAIIKKTVNNNNASAILIDISMGGIMIASPTSFDPNTPVNVEIFFATENPIQFVGRILRRNASKVGYTYGIVIEEIDNDNAISLNKLIENLISEKRGLFDELRLFKRMNIAFYVIALLIIGAIISILMKNL